MKISAINGFRSDVTFEKKPNKESIVASRPQTSSLKAIPLAVLIAMSPLNAVQAQNKAENTNSATKTEQVYEDKELLVLEHPKALAFSNGSCALSFISNDGDDSDAEKIVLKFKKSTPFSAYDSNIKSDKQSRWILIMDLDSIYTHKSILAYPNGERDVITTYSVRGNGVEYQTEVLRDDGTVLIPEIYSKRRQGIKISDEFYEYLKGIVGDAIPTGEKISTKYLDR